VKLSAKAIDLKKFFYSPANLGVVTPSNGLYREAPPKSGPFFRLQV